MNKSKTIIEQPARDPATGEVLTYTPGYVPHKIGMLLVGLLVLALGCAQLVPSLDLLFFGRRATAEATRILRTQAGLPEAVLLRDAEWKGGLQPNDRSVVFWNEFRFTTADGKTVTFRAPVGRQSQPSQPLLDDDGLPTEVVIYYDPQKPQRVLLPLELSSWFFAGTLTFFGLMGAAVSLVILYFSRTPIPLPHIVNDEGQGENNTFLGGS